MSARVKTSEILQAAADLIKEKGHAKGVYRLEDGRCCIVGAIYYAAAGPDGLKVLPMPDGALASVDYVMEALGMKGIPLTTWNDAPTTTPEMVIAALEGGAALAASRGH